MEFIAQEHEGECGIATLAMLFATYGSPATLDELRRECLVTRRGTSLASLLQAARRRGFEATAFSVEAEHLSLEMVPAILYWRPLHFVVMESVGRTSAIIADPLVGRLQLTMAEVKQRFGGIAMIIRPSGASTQAEPMRRRRNRRSATD